MMFSYKGLDNKGLENVKGDVNINNETKVSELPELGVENDRLQATITILNQ